MSATVNQILEDIRALGPDTPAETITYLGLLLEREAMSRYGDPIYEKLLFPSGWLELRPTTEEFAEIIEELVRVLERFPRLASTAAFALGKSYSDLAVPKLIAALERYWQADDETAYQLLIALDNYGLDRATDLVNQIARQGLPKSQEFAKDLSRAGEDVEDTSR